MFWTNDIHLTRRSQKTQTPSQIFRERYFNLSQQQSNNRIQQQQKQKQNDLKNKINKIISINKQHQLDEVCVCEDCIYAKQLQRYQTVKLDMSKHSTYKAEYNKHMLKRSLNNTIDLTNSTISRKTEDSSIKLGKSILTGSNYNKEFASKSLQKIYKPKPQDGLKFTGPTYNFSSYTSQYPKHNGLSQYVEPIKQTILPSLKFNQRSLYADSYKQTKIVKTESEKIPDQLRLGKQSLVNESMSKAEYNVPNPELSSVINKNHKPFPEKRIQTPNFSYQFRTINANEFAEPVQKKNCRNKRLQALYGQLLTSGDVYN